MPQLRILLALAVTPFIFNACGDDAGNEVPDAGPVADAPLPDAGQNDDPDAGGQNEATCAPSSLAGRIDTGAWDTSFTVAGLTGYDGFTPAVHNFGIDVDGSVLAAGYFLWAGTERVGPIARFRSGGWEPMRSDLTGADFSAVAISADRRVALATFEPLAPVFMPEPQQGEILVDTGTGLTSIGAFTGIVRSLAWFDGDLWVAGHFQLDAGPTELAVWDGTSWSAPPGGSANGPAYTLLAHGGSLYVGGSFSQVGGIAAASVAAWSGTAWSALSMSGLEPGPSGPFKGPIVFGLARTLDGALYASGYFFPPGQPASGGVAQWTGSSWEILGTGLAKSGGLAGFETATVSDVVIHQGDVYAAGCFSHAGADPDSATPLPGVARWDGTTWSALPGGAPGFVASGWFTSFVCGAEPSGTAILEVQLQALHSDGQRLFVGGAFAGVDGVASQSMIAHDGQRWVAIGAPAGKGVVGSVSELAVGDPECGVYTWGRVSHAGGQPTGGGVARFDGQTWTVIAAGTPENAYCTQLAVSPAGDVYFGCDKAGAATIYRLEEGAWTPLPAIPDVVGGVGFGELKVDAAGRLWVAGGSGNAGWLARLDGDAFTVIADDFDGNVTRIAFSPGRSSDEILVGGGFAHVGTLMANGVARYDGTDWHALGSGLTTTPAQNQVSALAWTENAIYASTYWSGPDSDHVVLGRFDGTAWEELGVTERGLPPHVNPDGEHQIYQLFARGDQVIAAGSMFPVEGGRNVFVFDGERFTPLGGGVGAISVDAFAATPDALWFGGSIATTGIDDTLASSVGVARFELAASP